MRQPDEDYAFETRRQRELDGDNYRKNRMTEETTKNRPERTPEEQAAHDKEMKERVVELLNAPIAELHSMSAFALADIVRAVIDGRLKPEDIPPTVDELVVVTYSAISRKLLAQKLKGMLGGRH